MQIANEDYRTELVLTISYITRNTTNMQLRQSYFYFLISPEDD